MQHRIFLAPLRPGLPHAEAHGHWCSNHGRLMLDLPHLRGYVQNQPLPRWWPHLGYLACSETWFSDRQSEAEAYASDWYKQAVTPDEQLMFAREQAWSSAIASTSLVSEGSREGFRVIAFGGDEANLSQTLIEGRLEVMRLARPAPGFERSDLVSVYCEDEAKADRIAARLGGLTFVARPVVFVQPPEH